MTFLSAKLFQLDNSIALADTEASLDFTITSIALLRTVIFLFAIAIRVSDFIVVTGTVNPGCAISKSIINFLSSFDWFEASHADTLALVGKVLTVESLAATSSRSDIRDCTTGALAARCGTNFDSKVVYWARLALVGKAIAFFVRVMC